MYKVKDAVREILQASEAALTAFSNGYLNYSAYAKTITKEVEGKTKKTTSLGNIIVALSRLNQELKGKKYGTGKKLLPKILLTDIVVKSSLVEITFESTVENKKIRSNLQAEKLFTPDEIHMLSQGVNEITIIASVQLKEKILKFFSPSKPKVVIHNLAAVTVRYAKDYLYTPNAIYVVIRALALKQINIIEIISTLTELSVIIEQKNLLPTFETLNRIVENNDMTVL